MSFFRTYIDEPIQKELFNRIDSLNFQKSPEGILDSVQSSVQHQFVKSCWARAVVVLGNDNLKSLNSNLNSNGNPINEPLNIKNGNPYRGKPGITSISTSFKEYFLKQATISVLVPDPNEFDEFKKDYLSFGRYMFVEFGWSLPYNLQLETLSGGSIQKISQDINKRIIQGKGNYNALVGVVTNYNYSVTKEGSYEVTIEISSMGRNILGQKSATDGKIENLTGLINESIYDSKENKTQLSDEQKKSYRKIRNTFINFNSAINSLSDIIEYYVKQEDSQKGRFLDAKYGKGSTKYWTKPGVMLCESSGYIKDYDKLVYCSWGWFEDYILNSFFSFVNESGNENLDFKTKFFSATGTGDDDSPFQNTTCRTNKNLFSLGLTSVILPGKTKEFTDEGIEQAETGAFGRTFNTKRNNRKFLENIIIFFQSNKYFSKFEKQVNGKTRGQIRNMVFEVNYLIESFKSSQNIEQSINEFWQKVSNDYGGFWRFSINEDPNSDGRIQVNDVNIGVVDNKDIPEQLSTRDNPNQVFKFPIYSKNSIISEYGLETSNTSEMATLAVYGSNVSFDKTSGDNYAGYSSLSLRALSLLDNRYVSEENSTPKLESDKQKIDSILQNINNPVYKNILDGKGFQGSSAEYDLDEGVVKTTKRDSGILFQDVPDIVQTDEKIEKDLTDSNSEEDYISTKEIRQGMFWFDNSNKVTQIYSSTTGQMLDEFKRGMLFLINKAPDGESSYSSVVPPVPLQISLTLQGIGGIKIGDLFYIDYLPEEYRKYCHFMVVSVNHEIGTDGWTTKLDSRMMVDVPKKINDMLGGKEIKVSEPHIVTTSLTDTVNDIQKKTGEPNSLFSQIIDDDELNNFEKIIAGSTALGNIATIDIFDLQKAGQSFFGNIKNYFVNNKSNSGNGSDNNATDPTNPSSFMTR